MSNDQTEREKFSTLATDINRALERNDDEEYYRLTHSHPDEILKALRLAALDGGAVSQQPSSERDIPKPAEVERISDMSVRVRFLSCAEAGRFAAFLAAEKEPK